MVLSRGARDARPRRAQRARDRVERATIALWSRSSGVRIAAGAPSAAADSDGRDARACLVCRTLLTLPFIQPSIQNVLPVSRRVPAMPAVAPSRPPRLAPWTRALGLAACVCAVTGCGRRATRADCQLIVDRGVELQMKGMSLTDTAAVQKREQVVRASLQTEIDSCEGRRVTERMMACVRAAPTTAELDQCLR